MSIRFRLSLIYTSVLVVVFFFFGIVVFSRSKATIVDDVDRGLQETAVRVTDQTKAYVLGDEAVLDFPDEELDVFRSATTFMVAVNTRGEIVSQSTNLANFNSLLDPDTLRVTNTFSTVEHFGETVRVLSAPLTISDAGGQKLIGYLQIARVMSGYEANLNNLRWTLILAGWAAVCLSLFLEDLLSHYSLKPLYDITKLASHITRADDLSRRLPVTGRNDEFGHLTRVMNNTLERLEQLFRAQQRLMADVSHELRTPLTTIRGNVDLIRRMGAADAQSLDAIQEEAERMTRLVNDLLLLARADVGSLPLQRQPVDLDALVGEAFQQVRRLEHNVNIHIAHFEHVRILGDPDRLKQLILNLLHNAIKYTPVGGRVDLGLRNVDGQACLTVADSGCGIPPEDLPHIFDRFYRVDRARARPNGGSGLGLAIAKWIVQAHEGRIVVESTVDVGTTFTVWLPALAPVTSPDRHTPEKVTARTGPLRILGTGR